MNRESRRKRRKLHIRKKLSGTTEKPRVYMYKSNKYTYIALTDDTDGKVFGSVRVEKGIKNIEKGVKSVLEIMKSNKIEKAVFDRSGYKYHGAVAEIAEQLRKEGIKV